MQDLMLMRQLYLTKRGLLVMERKALVNQMAGGDAMPHPSDNITRMADLATCLKENAAEENHVHRMIVRAAFRGVSVCTGTVLWHVLDAAVRKGGQGSVVINRTVHMAFVDAQPLCLPLLEAADCLHDPESAESTSLHDVTYSVFVCTLNMSSA